MNDFSRNPNGFKEAVCIEAQRIFDSCSDRDCLENLELTFEDPSAYVALENAAFVKSRCVEVINTFFSIEAVPFNKGFFSVDITYTFSADIEVYIAACTTPDVFTGITTFNKKVILYGSDGNTKYFSSDDECNSIQKNGCCQCASTAFLPKATVSVVEPICLDCKIVCKRGCKKNCDNCNCNCDEQSLPLLRKTVCITVGMFSIVQLSRAVPILIPAYDYCVPHKECTPNSDSPCELFEKIKFPTDEFFPRSLEDCDRPASPCGCEAPASYCDDVS